ncbi:MAG: hypothetical protein ABIH82_04780 [Candidatus Woesearchaeota archaeon]
MRILTIEGDNSIHELYQLFGDEEGVEFDQHLPREVHPRAQQKFGSPQELVTLVRQYDGLVLDRETFVQNACVGHPIPLLDSYLRALADSNYERRVIITTTQDRTTTQSEEEIFPKAKWLRKPLEVADLIRDLRE